MTQIAPSPLQLERLFFIKMLVEANPQYDGETPAFDYEFNGTPFLFEVGCGPSNEDDDNPSEFIVRVRLAIENANPEEQQAPYSIDLDAHAVFHLNSEFKCDDRQDLAKINGASMVISAMREQVSMLTGRSVYGPMTLPSLRVLPTPKAIDE